MVLTETVEQAKTTLSSLFPGFLESDFRVEEVETPLRHGLWRITFSSAVKPRETGNPVADILQPTRLREIVELSPETGELVAVKAA